MTVYSTSIERMLTRVVLVLADGADAYADLQRSNILLVALKPPVKLRSRPSPCTYCLLDSSRSSISIPLARLLSIKRRDTRTDVLVYWKI